MDPTTLYQLEERCRKSEKMLKQLMAEKDELEKGVFSKETAGKELKEALVLNAKLKYQLEHLKQNIEDEKSCIQAMNLEPSETNAINVLTFVSKIFAKSIDSAFPGAEIPNTITVAHAKADPLCSYQSNAALRLKPFLKQNGLNMSPQQVAQKIIDNLPPNNVIEKCVIAGPGFISIYVFSNIFATEVTKTLKKGLLPPKLDKKRVIVDFSSPNIAKEMHVGHLRSTIIGDSIARLLEFSGHEVLRVNHVGDWGTQFGMLIAHLQDKFPNFETESPPIADLQAFYAESKKRFDKEPEFKARAYKQVVALQAHEPSVKKAWELICEVSRREFQKIYDRLDITLTEKGESFYQPYMKKLIEELEKREVLLDDETAEGRKIMWTSERKATNLPLILVKSDGGFTYDTSDLAALRYRVEDEKADWCVYVIDNGQALHMKNVFSGARDLGFVTTTRLDHVGFGVVLGTDNKKFKSRDGNTVKLRDLLDEGVKRARAALETRENAEAHKMSEEDKEKLFEAIAYGCIKYSDLSHNRTNDYVFDYTKMLSDKGNTAVYLLYANTRIKSILRNPIIQEQNVDLDKLVPSFDIKLEHPKEIKLGAHIARYPEVLEAILDDLLPHRLCDFLYELCTLFTGFYDNCYCIEKKDDKVTVHINRLMLTKATGVVLEQGLQLLGLQTVERM